MDAEYTLTADHEQIRIFVNVLFRYADTGSFASIRCFDQVRRDIPPTFIKGIAVNGHLDELADFAADVATTMANKEQAIVFAPPVATFNSADSATTADISCGLALSGELDECNSKAAVTKLEGIIGRVTLVAASGGEWIDGDGEVHEKLHAHWRLSEPTRTAEEHELLRHARALAARLVGADPTGTPVGHPYRWPGSWHRKAAPVLSRIVTVNDGAEIHLVDAVERLTEAAEAAGLQSLGMPTSGQPEAPADVVASAMAAIPNPGSEVHYADWIRLGYAVHRATGGTGLAIWDAWSQKSDKYDAGETEAAWRRIGRAIHTSSAPRTIGAGTIFFHAQAAGWNRPEPEPPDPPPPEYGDPGWQPDPEPDADTSGPKPDGDAELTEQILQFTSASSLLHLELPPEEELLGSIVTRTSRVFLIGPTGTGKTMLGLAIAGGMASGTGFLHWRSSRPARVLYIDGEMPLRSLRSRVNDMARRLGGEDALKLLHYVSWQNAIQLALGEWHPLNTELGQLFIRGLCKRIQPDVIIFDNIQALLAGDMKDEVPWNDTWPLIAHLTSSNIGQIWLDHTGHDTSRQYGTSTKGWRFDTLGIMKSLPREDMAPGETGFTLSFEPPGKARNRTPENWNEYTNVTIMLRDDVWTGETAGGPPVKEVKLRPGRLVFHDALIAAANRYGSKGETVLSDWEKVCIERGLIDLDAKNGKAEFRKAKSELLQARYIGIEGQRVWDQKSTQK
jgi:hypothetical protein